MNKFVFLLLFGLSIFFSFPVQAQQSYLLNCSGWGTLEDTHNTVNIIMRDGNARRLVLGFQSNNNAGLARGECSWPDRGLNPGEGGNKLILKIESGVTLYYFDRNSSVTNLGFRGESHSRPSSINRSASLLNEVLRAHRSNGVYRLCVVGLKNFYDGTLSSGSGRVNRSNYFYVHSIARNGECPRVSVPRRI